MDKALQRLYTQGELAQRERTFCAQSTALKPLEILWDRVFRAIDDAASILAREPLLQAAPNPFDPLRGSVYSPFTGEEIKGSKL